MRADDNHLTQCALQLCSQFLRFSSGLRKAEEFSQSQRFLLFGLWLRLSALAFSFGRQSFKIKILHGFVKNGLAKVRLNLQMDF